MAEVSFDALNSTLEKALLNAGLNAEQAKVCARIHSESTRDGVHSHGIGRIPRFIDYVERGWVNVNASSNLVHKVGAIEVLDGNMGIGVTNALDATERAIDLSKEHGMGIVALRNTTHWMRGGSYGWHAVERGLATIMWTNTESCMPAWGAMSQSIGNNPLVMAVPHQDGPLVLDMAMSQFSYGKLQTLKSNDESLPVDGGFDQQGRLSRDPAAIAETRRLLPTGYWKGSGLAILLDAMAAMLSSGRPTHDIDNVKQGSGGGSCQIFMVFDPNQISGQATCEAIVEGIKTHLASAEPGESGKTVRWPGQSTYSHRHSNDLLNIDDSLWRAVCDLAS
ncbi:3-dehydro-L-gulonate 2-dehydrogenase [Halomonas dongshanensis]|uniref:3-dehydro-L-gulonate 2-dehydrogenase n=1 Tax=Halomonas dongshanensis TaxID=2890835 RepID=A0ABT2EAK9_9GAMM|nr:3-dehydro-L-gulonate 2-dehydrogenase [Halomonas dongshanensis]MCS2608618.1 3-dehydro-L-gulonate 2-dehydrogenase [Halomonas dongshanensis]